MKKRGSAHVEIIISVVLFAGFVVFLLNYLQPYKLNALDEFSLREVHTAFFNLASVDLKEVLIKNISMQIKCSHFNSTNVSVKSTPDPNFYYLSLSSEFSDTGESLPICSAGSYSIGAVYEKTILSNKSLHDIKKLYEENYSYLKAKMNFPSNADFVVISDNYRLEKEIPTGSSVNVHVYQKGVLYKNGDIIVKEFIFKVW